MGHTITSQDSLQDIDFGTQYSFRNITKEIFVENKSAKAQRLTWVRVQQKKSVKPKDGGDDKEKKAKKGKKDRTEQEFDQTFAIIPEDVNLLAKSGIMFQFRACALQKGILNELWNLNVSTGDERSGNTLYSDINIHGHFIVPSVSFEPSLLQYNYEWKEGVKIEKQTKKLALTCNSELPTKFKIQIDAPEFSIKKTNFELLPGKIMTIDVDFDPAKKVDRISGSISGNLIIEHNLHPNRDMLKLVGEVNFPNLDFDMDIEKDKIDFGCILNHTQKKIKMRMRNSGIMNVFYEWKFADKDKKKIKKQLRN